MWFAVSVPENRKGNDSSCPGGAIYQTYTEDIEKY